MKKQILMALALLLVTTLTQTAKAVENTEKNTKTAKVKKLKAAKPSHQKNAGSAKLGTSFKFDGSALRGKYQSSMGTAATVENDKYLDDLLSGRKQFADRIQDEKTRN